MRSWFFLGGKFLACYADSALRCWGMLVLARLRALFAPHRTTKNSSRCLCCNTTEDPKRGKLLFYAGPGLGRGKRIPSVVIMLAGKFTKLLDPQCPRRSWVAPNFLLLSSRRKDLGTLVRPDYQNVILIPTAIFKVTIELRLTWSNTSRGPVH